MGNPRYAVLVHKLPSDCMIDALALLPGKHIKTVIPDEVGLKIFFKTYDTARECILRRTILVQETRYIICPLVTNLTLHDIRQYASKSAVTDLMASYGPVLDLYSVEDITKDGNFVTKALTNDYRVILGIPEVLVYFELSPLQLPDVKDHTFRISFFCRLCRQNGHMQHQCLKYVLCISQQEAFHNESPKRQTARPETICSENSNGRFRRPSSQKDKIQISKEETSTAIDTGKRKKLVDPGDRPNYRYHYNEDDKSFRIKSQNNGCDKRYLRHENSPQIDGAEIKVENAVKQSPKVSQIQRVSYMNIDNFSPQTSIETLPSNKEYECCKRGQEWEKSPHKRRTEKNYWNRIIPPNFPLKNTKRLLLAVYNTKIVDIPQKVERDLQKILKWNHSRDKKRLKEEDEKFIKWLEVYLTEVSRKKVQYDNSLEGEQTCQPQNATDHQSSKEVKKKERCKRQRALSLCPGIEKIVLETSGILAPILLRNFLNQVRGRRKQIEIASHFEKDFRALSNQLREVEKSYYLYGKRGAREDLDIDFIKRLRQRLMDANAKEESCFRNKQSSVKRQSSCKRNLPNEYKSKKQKNDIYDSQDRIQKSALHVDKEEYPVKLKKCSLRGNLPDGKQLSTESYSSNNSEVKISSNLQRNLSYEEYSFRRSSSLKQFSAEEERQQNLKWVDKKNVPRESSSKQLSDSTKPFRNRHEAEGKFERDYVFCNTHSISDLSDSISSDSLGNSVWGIEMHLSNRTSSCVPQSSTDDDSLQRSRHVSQQNGPVVNPTTELPSASWQYNSVGKRPGIIKSDLRQMSSCVYQSAEVLPEITKSDLKRILSCAQQNKS